MAVIKHDILDAQEQYFLELVNRARLDPAREATRQNIELNRDLPAGTITAEAKQPLAPNALLQVAATEHSIWMLEANVFDHIGQNGSNPGERIVAAGYEFEGSWAWGENLALWLSTAAVDLDMAIVGHFNGLYESEGHRKNMFNAFFRETGVAQELGTFTQTGQDYSASLLTHKFAKTGTDLFLTGAVYSDTDGDHFYSIGEGQSDAVIRIGDSGVSTGAAGGYALAVAGTTSADVTLQHNTTVVDVTVTFNDSNLKLDLVDGVVVTSGDTILRNGATDLRIVGGFDASVTGNSANNSIHVGRGENLIDGAGGQDIVVFTGAQSDYSIEQITVGEWRIVDQRGEPGNDGANTVLNVEQAQFSDGTIILMNSSQTTGVVHDLSGAAHQNLLLQFTTADGTIFEATTDTDGQFAMNIPASSSGHLDVAPDTVVTEGFGVNDALNVLRIALDLTPDFGPAQPLDLIAADVDENGMVGVSDALDILRLVVGLEAEGAGRVVLFDPDVPMSSMAADSVDFESGMSFTASQQTPDLTLQTLVLGDLGVTAAV
jgi:hypothetical protein